MRCGLLRLSIAVPLLAGLVAPSLAAPPAAFTNSMTLDYDVRPDGQYTSTMHIERRAGTDAAARSLATFPWRYSPSHEHVTIVAAFTRRPDGREVPVDLATVRDSAPDSSQNLASFTDRREKVIPFPGLVAGDSIGVVIRDQVFHPLWPGVFSLALLFDQTQAWDNVTVNVTMPGSMKLLSDAVGPYASAIGDGAIVTYAWRYHDTGILPAAPSLLAPIERSPRLLVTTAADWQQIGRDYAAIATPPAAVTPLVRQTADTVTAGITDRRAMAAALYDWVRHNIGYIPLPWGDGNLMPHPADAVLTTRIGDSPDHAVLLSALLAAKGIVSEPVLINLDMQYRLSIPVPFAQLNHVMLYLPEWSVYADTTVGVARFGELPFADYGKPVVRAVASGEALSAIPALAPGAADMTLTTTAHLTADDMIVGDSRTEATGPFALALRLAAQRFAAAGAEAAAVGQLRMMDESGTGRFDPPAPEAEDAADALAGHFAVSAWTHISADHRLSLPDGLVVLPLPGDLLIGPLEMPTLPASEPTPCFAGRELEMVTLDVGPKYRVTQLPADRSITNDAFTYASHWSLDGKAVTVRRELVSRTTGPLCVGKLRQEAADAMRAIREDRVERVGLALP
jgi:transglutaminase-like putative cysteine protease